MHFSLKRARRRRNAVERPKFNDTGFGGFPAICRHSWIITSIYFLHCLGTNTQVGIWGRPNSTCRQRFGFAIHAPHVFLQRWYLLNVFQTIQDGFESCFHRVAILLALSTLQVQREHSQACWLPISNSKVRRVPKVMQVYS